MYLYVSGERINFNRRSTCFGSDLDLLSPKSDVYCDLLYQCNLGDPDIDPVKEAIIKILEYQY